MAFCHRRMVAATVGSSLTIHRAHWHAAVPMYFDPDRLVLDVAQALCVALPAAGIPGFLLWLRGRGWSLVAPLSLVLTIAAIGVSSASADVLTWIALVLVPLGCALALGWAAHGARPGWSSRWCRSSPLP